TTIYVMATLTSPANSTVLFIVAKNQPVYYIMDGGTTWEDRSAAIQPEASKLDSLEIHFVPVPGNGP
ncbi:MAG: hypothetical protein JXA23_02635, partial [Bacteroidales bacterium]|nr:hypothetical protein [Bacteroidales bacterium]